MGRPLGVVTVEVVVVVPAPARRRAVRGRVGAVVTGHVLVDVTGRGRLVVVVVTGRVRVDVTGRVWVVVVVAGAVPVPAIIQSRMHIQHQIAKRARRDPFK